jgi:hypothetical protein
MHLVNHTSLEDFKVMQRFVANVLDVVSCRPMSSLYGGVNVF